MSEDIDNKIFRAKIIMSLAVFILVASFFLPIAYRLQDKSGISHFDVNRYCYFVDWSANYFIVAFPLLVLGLTWFLTRPGKELTSHIMKYVSVFFIVWILSFVFSQSFDQGIRRNDIHGQCMNAVRFYKGSVGVMDWGSVIPPIFIFGPLVVFAMLLLAGVKEKVDKEKLQHQEIDLQKTINTSEVEYKTMVLFNDPTVTFNPSRFRYPLWATKEKVIIGTNPLTIIRFQDIKEISFNKYFGLGLPYKFPIKLKSGKTYKLAWMSTNDMAPFSLEATESVYKSLNTLWKKYSGQELKESEKVKPVPKFISWFSFAYLIIIILGQQFGGLAGIVAALLVSAAIYKILSLERSKAQKAIFILLSVFGGVLFTLSIATLVAIIFPTLKS